MTPEQRKHYDNGIWMCANHAALVDENPSPYTVEELRQMKQAAENRAAAELKGPGWVPSSGPSLHGQIEWRPPTSNETRPGYEELHHAVFRIAGNKKQRGRVYIEVAVDGGTANRVKACMAEGVYWVHHERADLRPGEPYTIPVFTQIRRTSKFWLDKRLVPDHPFWKEPPIASLQPGVYLMDQPFLDQVHRAPLVHGGYQIRVVLILGDTEDHQTFYSEWKDVIV